MDRIHEKQAGVRDLKKLRGKRVPLLRYFAEEPSIEGVYLFGSFGTPYERPNSDLDLAVLFAKAKNLWDLLEVQARLSLILERDDVDLLDLRTASLPLRYAVISTGTRLFARNPIKIADFVEQTLDYYLDYKPVLDRFHADYLEHLKEAYS